jgi:hypothetical protein
MAKSKAVSFAITATSSGVRSEVERVNKTLKTMGAAAQKAAKDLAVLKTIEIAKIGFAGISAGAGIITGLGSSALEMASRVSTSVDSLNDLANRTGIALKPLQGLGLAAKLAGVDTEAFGAAVTKMSVNIGKAEAGDAFSKSLDSIGVSLAGLQGMDPEAQFSAISKAIGEIPSNAGRAAAAVEIFGKAGAALAPLFKDGAASLEELTARAERLGIILSDDQVNNISAMNDGFDLVSATVDGIIGQILGDLSPVVTKMLDDMLKFVEAFQGAGGATGGTAIAQAITDGILIGVKFFLQGVQSLEKVFLDFLMAIDQLPGIKVNLPEGAKRVAELRSMISNQQTQADALGAGTQRAAAFGMRAPRAIATGMTLRETNRDISQLQRALRASEKKMGSAGVQVAIDFMDGFRAELNASRQAAAAETQRVEAVPLMSPDSPATRAARADFDRQRMAAADAQPSAKARKDLEQQAINFSAELALKLARPSQQALVANDVRSSAGASQVAAFRRMEDDPALDEARAATKKLEEIKQKLEALNREPVDML